jgi:hypothetical protein
MICACVSNILHTASIIILWSIAALLYGMPACARRSYESQGDEDNQSILLYHIHINITFQVKVIHCSLLSNQTLHTVYIFLKIILTGYF